MPRHARTAIPSHPVSTVPDKHPTESLRWQGEMGEKWNAYHEQFEGMIAPVGAALIEAASFRPGEAVIDVGCGAGVTTLEIARRIAPRGRVTGLDISQLLIGTAERRAKAAGLHNAALIQADAAMASPGRRFDCLFSRFGLMFFDDPRAAFANMHNFLKPDGRLVFACWGPMRENPWAAEAMGVVAAHKELPKPVPRAPGPFAFAETEYVRDILEYARFKEVSFTAWRGPQFVGGPGADAQRAAQFLMDAAFVGDAIAGETQQMKDRVQSDLRGLFAKFESPKGVCMPGVAWIVSAKA
jgi:SAM-dependent methyltransferase